MIRTASVNMSRTISQKSRLMANGTVCLISALRQHELTTQLPHAVWMMIPHKARAPISPSFPLKIVRASGDALTSGIERISVEGVEVPIYGVAKTVADCFKYRRLVGEDVAIEALRDALRFRKTTAGELGEIRSDQPMLGAHGASPGATGMTKIIKDKSASIRARLLMHSKQSGEEYQRNFLTRFAIERLLFRLSQSDMRDRYVLKGAMLFVTWPEYVFRPTGDLDLLGHGDPDPSAIVETFQQ